VQGCDAVVAGAGEAGEQGEDVAAVAGGGETAGKYQYAQRNSKKMRCGKGRPRAGCAQMVERRIVECSAGRPFPGA
jgi:hypothetical protein